MVPAVIFPYVLVFLSGFYRLSQLKTLAACVAGLLESCEPIGMGPIGRNIPGSGGKHGVKRVYRFAHNSRISLEPFARAFIGLLTQACPQVIVAMDWTDIGPWKVLTSAIVTRHRAIPVYWTVICNAEERMAPAEIRHVSGLRRLIPQGGHLIITADRGFDSVETLRFLQAQDIYYVIRFGSTVSIRLSNQSRARSVRDLKLGHKLRDFGFIEYSVDHRLRLRFVHIHEKGQKEAWNLATNIPSVAEKVGHPAASAKCIVALYGRRFSIEEAFRDLKGGNWELGKTQIKDSQVLTRFLLIPVTTYVLLTLVGQYAEQCGWHRRFQTNTRQERVLALWRVGRLVLKRGQIKDLAPIESCIASLALSLDDLCEWVWRPRKRTVEATGPYATPPKTKPRRLSAQGLRAFLDQYSLRPAELAERIGIQRTTVYHFLRGLRKVPLAWTPILCDIAHISREKLYSLGEWAADHIATVADKLPRAPKFKDRTPGLCLKVYLERFQLTQANLARQLGARKQKVFQVLSGARPLPEKWLPLLCANGLLTVEEFLALAPSKPAQNASVPKTG